MDGTNTNIGINLRGLRKFHQFIHSYGRKTNNIYYTVLLPIRKNDIVQSKCNFSVFVQSIQLG